MKVVKNSPEVRKLYRQSLKWHNENFDKLTGIKKVGKKMKLFTPENQETYRIKKIVSAIKKAIVHLNVVAVVLIFISCGSDDIMNNGSNPPVSNDIVKLDSIVSRNLNGASGCPDTTLNFVNNDFDSLKITFYVESNSTFGDPTAEIYITDTTGHTIFGNTVRNFNQEYTFYCRTTNIDYSINLRARLWAGCPVGDYVKMKDIRITKL